MTLSRTAHAQIATVALIVAALGAANWIVAPAHALASIIGMAGYWLAGLWVPAVTHYFLVSLPVTLIGVFLGRVINHRLHGDAFLKYIYLCLAGIGALLLVQAATRQF